VVDGSDVDVGASAIHPSCLLPASHLPSCLGAYPLLLVELWKAAAAAALNPSSTDPQRANRHIARQRSKAK